MNNEVENYEIDVKLDANGDVDVNYYLHKGEDLRAQYLSELYLTAKRKVKSSITALIDKVFGINGHPSH